MNRIPLMCRRIIWVEFYAAFELFLRRRRVPIVIDQNMRQRRVRFGECVIQCQRLYCRFFCLWHCFVRRGKIVKRQASVGIREPDVAKSKIRIALDALLEVLDRLFDSVRSTLVPKIAATQVELICLCIRAVALDQSPLLLAGQFQLQLRCDLLRNCLFDRNQVRDLAIVSCAPNLRARHGVHQIHLNVQSILRLPHFSCQHRRHPQLASHLARVDIFLLVTKSHWARDHSQLLQLTQAMISASEIPSDKYSVFGSLLAFSNGSTAIDFLDETAAADSPIGAADGFWRERRKANNPIAASVTMVMPTVKV